MIHLKNVFIVTIIRLFLQNQQKKELLSASFQGFKRLFALAYFIAAPVAPVAVAGATTGIKYNRKYFLPRGEIKNYNVFIDGRNFYDQPIDDIIKQYGKVRKVSARQGNGYTTG